MSLSQRLNTLVMSVNQRLNFGFCHPYQLMKIQSLCFSNGKRFIGGISQKLSVTSQTRLFKNNEKSLFSLKNKNLQNDNIICNLRKNLIWEKSSLGSLNFLFTQNICNDFLSCVTIHLLYPPQKTLRHCRIFHDASLSFYGILCLNIMLCNVMQYVI